MAAESDEDLEIDGSPPISDNQLIVSMSVAGRVGHGAIIRGSKLVIWGGYTKTSRNKEGFLVVNLETGKKMKMDPQLSEASQARLVLGEQHRRRFATCYSASAYAVSGNFLYTFGGHSLISNHSVNYLFRFEFRLRPRPGYEYKNWIEEAKAPSRDFIEWEILDACADVLPNRPSPRDKHALFIYDNKIYSFGGFGPSMQLGYLHNHGDWKPNMEEADDRGWNNQFLVYDFDLKYWQNPPTTGRVPCPRAAHSMCVVDSRAYLFGGRSEPRRLNDLYYLDLRLLQWTAIDPGGDLPCPRSWASLTQLDESHLFVFGGMDNERSVVGDGYVLNLRDMQMRRIVEAEDNTKRLWHATLISDDNRIIVVGGCSTSIYAANPDYPDAFLQLRLYRPSSLYATCLRHCDTHIENFSSHQLSTLNHFVGLDILNRRSLAHRSSYPCPAAGV